MKSPVVESASVVTVRPAAAEDVPFIFENIGYWAHQGKMLVRPMQNIFENLRDFFVAELQTDDGPVFAGNGALHILWGDIAEVRGLAVRPDVVAKGVGRALVGACEAEARRVGDSDRVRLDVLGRVFREVWLPAHRQDERVAPEGLVGVSALSVFRRLQRERRGENLARRAHAQKPARAAAHAGAAGYSLRRHRFAPGFRLQCAAAARHRLLEEATWTLPKKFT